MVQCYATTINNDYLSNENLVQRIILNKITLDDSLGISFIVLKHCRLNFYAVFINNIQSNSLAYLNGQLHIADQIICINDIYLDSSDSKLADRIHQLLFDSKRLSIELVIIRTTNIINYSYAAVSSAKNNGHSCIPILSTPFNVDMVLNTLWTQIEVVELTNDGSGLGFGISGNKSTGVVVKALIPGSISDKDGRIHTGDHLFQINHVYVRGMSSDQVAGILRQCSEQVRLVVARSVREPPIATNNSPSISQSHSLTSENFNHSTISNDNDGIINSSQKKIFLRTERLLENNHNLEKILDNLLEQCQYEDGTQLLDVTLEKGDDGLGITVAGYVSPDSTNNDAIAGIFIRDIAEGSVSARDGRLAIGDQIIEVNDQSLNGFSNVQALYLLQNTSSSVRLKVRRYCAGDQHDKIKEMIALESSEQIKEKIEFQDQSNINEQIRQKWLKSLGNNYDIFIIDIYKPDNGNLGITLEGTIDRENGEDIGAHHYIRTLSNEGIIEKEGTLKPGDELLEINNQILYGKDHIQVIQILKRVKDQIKLICARRKIQQIDETNIKLNSNRSQSISFGKTTELVVKAKSMGTLDLTNNSSLRPTKTRSLEVISNLALWSTTILTIELNKNDYGLGFSVLDYQDPSNPSYSPVIVIRSLVPGGVAQLSGRLIPGDRLVAVNDIILENMTLDDVILILKSTPKGPVKLSISKPLPYPKFKNDSDEKIIPDSDQNINSNKRLSRISKSKTTTEITNNHKRSASSHRSINQKAAVSPGIALSAPAILSQHEYIETLLLKKENLIKQPKQRASSANRNEKASKTNFLLKKSKFKSDIIRPIKFDLSSSENLQTNLPEFKHFQSDHLVLTPRLTSHSSSDRLHNSLNYQTSKFKRQSNTPPPPPPPALSSSRKTNSTIPKRISRIRHSYDSVLYHGKQQQKYLLRSLPNKFDSMSCFNEPDLSSDDNNNHNNNNNYHFTRSSSLTNPQFKSNMTQSGTDLDEIDAIHQDFTSKYSSSSSSSSSLSKQSSRIISPVNSQSSGRIITLLNHEVIQLPGYLEREIIIKYNFDQLNLKVDASIDEGVNGCCISSIISTSIDNCLQVGDFLISINNENMRKISNAQARAIIRRASLIGSDISIIFILGEEAKQFKDQTLNPQLITSKNFESDIDLSQTKFHDDDNNNSSNLIDTESLCLTLWGSPRIVILHRDQHVKNLGISIVGGKLDFSGPGNTIETCISGIFIKHVIPDSLAGLHSTLKTGDRILEVNGYNLRDATHDHAVEMIRSACSPIYLLVQSLLDSTNTNSYEKQYENFDGEILTIEIKRNSFEINEPLGLSLIGHRDPEKLAVFVCDIQSNSLLGRDKQLQIGDQLLQINDEILLDKPHSIVTSIIKAIKTERLTFIILRNPNAINKMAFNNPYTSNQHHVNEYKKINDRSTSVFPLLKQPLNDHMNLSNSIITTNDVVQTDKINFSPLSSDVNQKINDLLPPPSPTPTSNINHQIISVNKQKLEYNGPFVSHIPMMSSSSSSSSIDKTTQIENLNFNDPRTRPIMVGQETLIEIDREQSGLGLSVVGGSDTQLSAVIIHDIYDGCAAQRDGRLLVGDQILEVNSIDLRLATHEQAIQALRQSTNIIRMIILRREIINEEDKFNIITVDFIKKAHKGLGFSIIGRRNGFGVFISHIIEGGSAEKDGRLMSGDLILEVNGQDLRTAAYSHVAYTLKTLPHGRVYIKIGRLKVNASQTDPEIHPRSPTTNKSNNTMDK